MKKRIVRGIVALVFVCMLCTAVYLNSGDLQAAGMIAEQTEKDFDINEQKEESEKKNTEVENGSEEEANKDEKTESEEPEAEILKEETDSDEKADDKNPEKTPPKNTSSNTGKKNNGTDSGNSGSTSGNKNQGGTSGNSTSSGNGNQKPSGTSSNSSNGGSGSSSGSASPAHTHKWVAQTTTVYHDATGHYESRWVQDSAAWDEPVYSNRSICNGCGADITGNTDHIFWCDPGSYSIKKVQTSTIHHEATGHNESYWVQDSAAWTETKTIGYKCSGCGASK